MPNQAWFHLQWRNELSTRAMQAAKQMGKAQERFKRNYDATNRPAIQDSQVGAHVFVRLERNDGKMPEEKKERRSRHKLATIATGPHQVVEFNGDTNVIRRGIEVERVPRDRVVNAPLQEPLVNEPNAPASVDPSLVDKNTTLPAQPLPNSEILDLPRIDNSVHTRVQPGLVKSTLNSEDIPESENKEVENPSKEATVSEAIVEGPHRKQKTASANSASAGAATKKGIIQPYRLS